MKRKWTRNRYPARVDILPTILVGASWLAIWFVWPTLEPKGYEPLRPFTSIRYMPGLIDARPASASYAPLGGVVDDPELKDSQFMTLLKSHPYEFLAFVPPGGPARSYTIPEKPLAEQAQLNGRIYKPVFERAREPLPPVERPLLSWEVTSSLEGMSYQLPEEISSLQYGPAWRISARVETDPRGRIREAFLTEGAEDPALNAAALRSIRMAVMPETTHVLNGVITIIYEGKEKPAENVAPVEEPDENQN